MTDFAARLASVKQAIFEAETHANRPQQVTLLAVSKTRPISDIEAAYQQGLRAFGENYVQEGVDKVIALSEIGPYKDIHWHFIGPLQSNKTRAIAEHFHWLHTLEREKIAQRLNDQRPVHLPPLNVLIQVNISAEDSKAGISLDEVPALAQAIAQLPNLSLRGLMCIPAPAHTDTEQLRLKTEFEQMAAALKQLQQHYPQADTLSMGMSDDLALAIAAGSTMVRIGTALFGPRS